MLCASASDVDRDDRSGRKAWRNSGSPEPDNKSADPERENSGSKLQKSTLSSNIGELTICVVYFYFFFKWIFTAYDWTIYHGISSLICVKMNNNTVLKKGKNRFKGGRALTT